MAYYLVQHTRSAAVEETCWVRKGSPASKGNLLAGSIGEIKVNSAEPGKSSKDSIMKRVGFLLKVKADRLEEYKEHHQKVWPEMLQALQRNGWHNYSIFAREDGLLFGYFETPDSLETAQKGMAREEINAKWQQFMVPYFENLGGAHADESMQELPEIFHLD